jgi:N-dimethylarginine dimethylaminohydrolase
MVGRLRKVLVARPGRVFGSADRSLWHYSGPPDLDAAQREHDGFVETLRKADIEVFYHDACRAGSADAIFTHDPCILTDAGAILLHMGKPLREGEPAAIGETLQARGIPILHRLRGEERAEGGDLLWIDARTLAVGLGFRTNSAGSASLRRALTPLGVTVVEVQLPYYQGPDACLHLMSLVSLLDRDLAVVYPPLLPVSFWELLRERDYRVVAVPEEEFSTMGPNVLALAPRRGLMLENNPSTRRKLEQAGCRVETYRGREISLKAEGGATCLTRPILRDAE